MGRGKRMSLKTWRDLKCISMSLSTKKYYYNLLYNIVDDLFRTYDPCKFNSAGQCIANRANHTVWNTEGGYTGCCKPSCKYVSSKGCSTNSLGCKLYTCSTIERKFPGFYKEIQRLKEVAWHYNLPWNTWQSEEDWITVCLEGEIVLYGKVTWQKL